MTRGLEPLRGPSVRYASGVDRRDVELFLSAFTADGTLTVAAADGTETRRGHEELATVIERIRRYDRTFHLLGQLAVEYADDKTARAEVYCVAHHWQAREGGEDQVVMYIRYQDVYRRDPAGIWRISARTLQVDGRETR